MACFGLLRASFGVGALLVAALLNGLTMLNAPYYAQDFVKGLVLVLALMFTFGLAHRAR